MGPTLLFDKSFLQTLTVDEAVLLDQFFCAVISPIFYVETLADLEKKSRSGRTPEDEVGIIASKIPQMNSAPMLFHPALAVRELMGTPVPTNGRMFLSGAKSVSFLGHTGKIQDPGPEHDAVARWQVHQFFARERSAAKSWRQKLRRINLSTLKAGIRAFGALERCSSLDKAQGLALGIVNSRKHQRDLVKLALIALAAGPRTERAVLERWATVGQPALIEFAPYAAFILRVEAFFAISHESGLISYDPNSRSDIAYFHYAPFCNVFVSSDKLHRRTANFFLRKNQTFVEGPQLKESLHKLVERYLSRPQEEQDNGLPFTPPTDDADCLVAQIWDNHKGTKWRVPSPELSPEIIAALKDLLKDMKAEQEPIDDETAPSRVSSVELNRLIPKKRGSFRLVPKHIVP